mgnify:CR=1 FL=1
MCRLGERTGDDGLECACGFSFKGCLSEPGGKERGWCVGQCAIVVGLREERLRGLLYSVCMFFVSRAP